MNNLNRIEPRDGERIDEDSCPDCFHAKDGCVCELECPNCGRLLSDCNGNCIFPVPVLADQSLLEKSYEGGEARESTTKVTGSMVPDSRGGENICDDELGDWLDNLPKPPEPLPYYMRAQKQITDRSPFE